MGYQVKRLPRNSRTGGLSLSDNSNGVFIGCESKGQLASNSANNSAFVRDIGENIVGARRGKDLASTGVAGRIHNAKQQLSSACLTTRGARDPPAPNITRTSV